MHTLFWILAFVGVAFIYPIPALGNKFAVKKNINAGLKLFGVILAIVSLLVLYRTGGFN